MYVGTVAVIPELLETGKNRREELVKTVRGQLDVGLTLVSPMKRTLETAMIALDWLLDDGVPIQAHAGWQGLAALSFHLTP